MIPGLTIATTLYRSRNTIDRFLQRAIGAGEAHGSNFEIIVVDDGSPDNSADLVKAWVEKDPRIKLVQLSRNFGHHRALLVALEQSRGDMVFLIDSDLEEPPEMLNDMARIRRDLNVDCLYGVQEKRKGGLGERLSGWLFYRLFEMLSEVRIPENVSTVRLMTRRYVDSLLNFRDKNPVFVPLTILAGYPQAAYAFTKASTSKTTYSLGRRIGLTILAITSFSARPLMLMLLFSLMMALVGALYGAFVVVRALTGPVQDGWSSLMAVVVFFFSLNAVFTGLIGLYLKQILEEVKDRPRSVIKDIHAHASNLEERVTKPDRLTTGK